MGTPNASLMKTAIKTALLSEPDPNNPGHPLYCKKAVNPNTNTLTFDDTNLTDNLEIMVARIAEGVCTYLGGTWMPSVTVSTNVTGTSISGGAVTGTGTGGIS